MSRRKRFCCRSSSRYGMQVQEQVSAGRTAKTRRFSVQARSKDAAPSGKGTVSKSTGIPALPDHAWSAVVPLEVAMALYVAIMTDTGSFRFANTSPVSHLMAAHLQELGVDPRAIHQTVHEQLSLSQLHLLGEMLASLNVDVDERIAWTEVRRDMLERAGLTKAHLEGFIRIFQQEVCR